MNGHMRLVVLVSGNGSNLQAILDACESGVLAAEVVAVVSNKHDVKALERAESAGVPAVVVSAVTGESRADYDTRLTSVVSSFMADFVVLAGYMRILSMEFLSWFPEHVTTAGSWFILFPMRVLTTGRFWLVPELRSPLKTPWKHLKKRCIGKNINYWSKYCENCQRNTRKLEKPHEPD
jgi:hypothetical protein